MHWTRKWQPTPVFLPGESQGQGSLVSLWGRRVGHDWSDLAAAVLGARSLKSWCQQDHTPSESCRRILPCLFQFLVVLWQLWAFFSLQLHTPISAFIITWRFPCLCLHMAIFLCKHQSYWIKSPHYSSMTLFNLTMTLFPNKMTLCSTGGCCYSVVMLCLTLCDPMDWGHQDSPSSPSPGACSNLSPLSQWCHPTISSSVILFSFWGLGLHPNFWGGHDSSHNIQNLQFYLRMTWKPGMAVWRSWVLGLDQWSIFRALLYIGHWVPI